MSTVTFDDFDKLDIRVGKITDVKDFPEAHKPAYIIHVDFGDDLGIKKTSAQVTHYNKSDLYQKLVFGLVNVPPKQIGPITSEFLLLGVPNASGKCQLITPDANVPLGGKLY